MLPDAPHRACDPLLQGGRALRRATAAALAAAAVLVWAGAAAPQAEALRLKRIGTFTAPTYVAAPPGDRARVFVVERPGTIRVIRRGRRLRRAFLDISSRVRAGGEQGLLSMAFPPDYRRTRRFYVYYTDRAGDIRIEEYRRSRRSHDRAVRSTRRTVLVQAHRQFSNHNGGQLQFGRDGLLYAGLGDGGGGGDPFGAGQDLSTLLGTIIRIDPRRRGSRRYTIPRTNPFRGRAGARPEIYIYGVRNPWRFSFDRSRGSLVVADVGQGAVEEGTFFARGRGRGANLGWSIFEGSRRFRAGTAPGHVPPQLERTHSRGWCSIIGGYIVRDRSLGRREQGRYIYGDFCRRDIRSVRIGTRSARGDRATGLRVEGLSSFGEDARGRIHVATIGGAVYRIVRR